MQLRQQPRRLSLVAEAKQPRAPKVTRFDSLPADANSSWTVQQILDALDEHESGYFLESSKLIDAMGRDDRIRADRETRVSALVGKNGARFSIESGDEEVEGDDEEDESVAWVRSWWFDAFADNSQRSILRNAIMGGVAYGPISWVKVGAEWHPRVKVWNNQHLYHDGANYIANTTQGPQIVSPENGWFLYTPDSERSWLIGAVRALGLLWKMRQFNWRDWARFCERHGMPLIAITEPPGADTSDQEASTAAFYRSLQGMGSSGVVRLPQLDDKLGWKLEYRETVGANHATFEAFQKASIAAIAICLLGQNINEEGGSYAKATALLRVAQHYLDSDAETFSTTCREQLVIPAGRFNRAGWDDRKAPWPTWATGLPEDKVAKVTAWKAFSEALDKLLARGVQVDVGAMAEQAGVPLLSTDLLPPEPPPSPGKPTTDDAEDGATET